MGGSRRWASLMAGVASVLVLSVGNMVRGATPADAYMFMCCQFPRNWAPNLYAAIWPQHYFDTSAWFENAVIDGIDAVNSAPSAVYVSIEFTEDSSAPVMFWTDTNPSDGSTGGCYAVDSNNECQFGVMQLAEGCDGNGCQMTENTPNYDEGTVAHELVHVLGLDHTCTPGQLMSGPNPNCSNGGAPYACPSDDNCVNTPQQDDINGLVREYGSGSSSSGSCSSTAPPGGAPPPVATAPQSIPVPMPPAVPTPPDSNYVDTVQSAVGAAAADPMGTAGNAISMGKAATGKVVPWNDVPSVALPGGGVLETQPC